MAQTTVAQFASELKVPTSVLLKQLHAAGVDKKFPEDSLSDADKARLLGYLRKVDGRADAPAQNARTERQRPSPAANGRIEPQRPSVAEDAPARSARSDRPASGDVSEFREITNSSGAKPESTDRSSSSQGASPSGVRPEPAQNTAARPESPQAPTPLARHQQGADYDDELETLIRVAAKAGLVKGPERSVNYTTLLIGFAFCGDASSRFLQDNPHFKRAPLLASRDLTSEANSEMQFVYEAVRNTALPPDDRIYSSSAVRMLDIASDIAATTGSGRIGTRHLLAAILFSSGDHNEDLRRWGLDAAELAAAFVRFVERNYLRAGEDWRLAYPRLGLRVADAEIRAPQDGSQAPTATAQHQGTVKEQAQASDAVSAAVERARYVATFGSDDPTLERRDLLDVRDEARAFARIVASRNTRLPLSIGVFGEWGSGKTFFMALVSDHVQRLSVRAKSDGDASLFLPDIVQIQFNAWHYIETNLWASLVDYIFSELDRTLQRNDKPSDQVERLFEQLSTSRTLKLEAIEDLIVKRQERKNAAERLDRVRRDYEAALLRQSAATSADFWRAVYQTFREKFADAGGEERVKKLAGALGLKDLEKSAGSLHEVLKEAETEAGRARVLHRAMVAKIGQWPWIVAAVLVLVLIPAGVVALKDVLREALKWQWVGKVNEAVLALSSFLAAASVLAARAVRSARSALTELEGFRKRLDDAVKERTKEFKGQSGTASTFAEAERDAARLKNELEQAEHKFSEADKRSDEVLRDYRGASARGRLNTFIREKLASGDYAKHLGLIATIRKDFEQLAQLMADAANDKGAREKYALAQKDYRKRLAELLARAAKEGSLSEKEASDFDKDRAEVDPGLFSRIILYIDDLDRCPPDKVVDVLQAIHLLLYFPLFVVVVAVDARWVSRALREQFPQLLTENIIAPRRKGAAPSGEGKAPDKREEGEDVPGAATSHDYLEKIFQIPYWVPPMDGDASKKYVKGIANPEPRGAPVAGASSGLPDAKPQQPQPPAPDAGTLAPAETRGLSAAGAATPESGQTHMPTQGQPPPPPPPPDPEQAEYVAKGMTLTKDERDFLEAFAPYVGNTPRRGLRFVNVYRLVKTSLSEKLQDDFQEASNHLSYRALMTQLAIVTGAPHLSWTYFAALAGQAATISGRRKGSPPTETLASFRKLLERELSAIPSGGQKQAMFGAFDCLERLNRDAQIDVGEPMLLELHRFAPVARRYSFTARQT